MTIEKLRYNALLILKDENLTDYETFEKLLGLLQENENLLIDDLELYNLKKGLQLIFDNKIWENVGLIIDEACNIFENEIIRYEVQDWMGKVLHECENLSQAVNYKELICETEEECEDIYIIGFNIFGKELPPQW